MVARLERYVLLQKFECAVGFDVIVRPTHCVVIEANCQCRKLAICVFDKAACGLVTRTGVFLLSGVVQHVTLQQNNTFFSVVKFRPSSPPLFYVPTSEILNTRVQWLERQLAVPTSCEISILSPVRDKHLLSMDKCFKFCRRFAILNIDYKLINSHTQI